MDGTQIRLNRLFSKQQKAVIIAIDHGMFDGPIPGMIDLVRTAENINPQVDGVLLSPGMLPHLKNVFNFKGAPIPIVRINWSTIYCFHWNYRQAATVAAISVEEAIARGAEMVLISLTLKTGDEIQDARNIEVFCSLLEKAHRFGIPVVGEFFPTRSHKLSPSEMHEQVYSSCRILSELGADLIKTFYTHRFKEVAESNPVPVLGLGAEKKPTQLEALELAADEIRDGAGGVVFGRNAIQVKDPHSFQAALCEVVKNQASPREMVEKFTLTD